MRRKLKPRIAKPKTETAALGAEIARLRYRKHWSVMDLLREVDKELEAEDYEGKLLSTSWLYRLENGEVVILRRSIFNALCRALRCNKEEYAKLYLLSDRNITVDIPGKSTPLAEAFNLLMFDMYQDVCTIVEGQVEKQHHKQLTQADINQLFYTAIELVIARRRS